MNDAPDSLRAVLHEQAIALPNAQVDLLERYCALLWEWNAKINLTRHTDYHKFVARDLVDSLAFAEFLGQGERVLDVGSGGGVPGVVLAIVRPDLKITLAESVGKRARALDDVVEKLGLPLPVCHVRAERYLADHHFDTLVIRAVARLKKLLEWFKPHWSQFDRMLLIKGPSWPEERGEARHFGLFRALSLRKLKVYPLPAGGVESVVLEIRRNHDGSGDTSS
ncbi:MAG: 16S rRNA (guanine(527)-N(7))-methyltransferase RsmG [Phycisphaerae bacterium]|nr:16S rRNA (guanine(527)-N(7))-methyltransferase RsmG [Phycisphaerae bacterium]